MLLRSELQAESRFVTETAPQCKLLREVFCGQGDIIERGAFGQSASLLHYGFDKGITLAVSTPQSTAKCAGPNALLRAKMLNSPSPIARRQATDRLRVRHVRREGKYPKSLSFSKLQQEDQSLKSVRDVSLLNPS